ncbi:hypothetical protein D1B31_19305 [Neobacillus notoginsengisoli]|uniref:Resolvase HTH domain-containing protein n=1 Tax=Neobacillus notoginsengisoli TaxID=1578198 RepID=A0A417YMP7_9BACI|nr:hypothetical protein [Neobacillus notoginsengisoli]RHW34816.1 hypothetical protein D1B31_19305 [Neobacillus notoginsengisoli]
MPKGKTTFNKDALQKAVLLYQEGNIKVLDIIKVTGCSQGSLYKAIHKQKIQMKYDVKQFDFLTRRNPI